MHDRQRAGRLDALRQVHGILAELLGGGRARVLVLAGMATFFVSFDSAVLVLALPAIASDFHTSVPALSGLGSALALGTIAGLPLAILADRRGRRLILVVTVAGFSITNLASAWSPSLAWLAGSRAVAVCFETVASVTAIALVVEEVREEMRGLAVSWLAVVAGAGMGLTTLLYPLLAPNWRALYLIGGSGLVGALVLAALLREGRTWSAAVAGGDRPRLPLRVLLQPPWRARLAVAAGAAALSSLLYEPAGVLVALFGSRALGLGPPAISAVTVVAGLASVPAFVVGGRLSDRYGRRWLAVGLGIVATAFTAVTFSGTQAAYWAGNVLWSVAASTSVPVVGAWYAELFPTRARATSEAAGGVAGAVGGLVGFQLIGQLQPRLGLGLGLMALGAGALLASVLLALLPETRGAPLEP